MESVVIPDTVTSIGVAAFQNCSSLTDITLPRGLTAISRSSFSGCSSLATINIPDNVTIIEGFAFSECISLNNIVIPENVTTIQGNAFQGCTSLTEIKIPEKVTLIVAYAFDNCTNLESITMPQNDEFVKINKYTFSNCTNLKEIIIPSTVTSIEQGAFSDCASLTEIIIPSSVKDIKYNVFDGCSNLKKAYIYNKETVFRSDVFASCSDDLTIFGYSGSTAQTYAADPNGDGDLEDSINFVPFAELEYTYDTTNKIAQIVGVPDGMNLGDYVISGLVLNPNDRETYTVTSIGIGAFGFKDTLTSIEIPQEVTNIEYMAFCNSTNLASVNFLGEISSIGHSAFIECTGLTSISIPKGITKLEESMFWGCTSLINVILPQGITSIDDYAFYKCSSLTNINIPEEVIDIGEQAFYGCTSLISIDIPKGVTSIKFRTFSECSNLESINIGEGVTSIEDEAFTECRSLENINIGKNVTHIGNSSFMYCTNLTNINLMEGVETLGSDAFAGCDSLTSIEIPKGVTSIGEFAFGVCNNLMSITIYGEETVIGERAFDQYIGTIYGYANSTAQTYAKANNINFEPFMSAYKVEHYQESLDGEYVLIETEDLEGASKTTITAVAKTYEGFTYDNTIEGTVEKGIVAEDDSLVLKLYYTRNEYTITFNTNGGSEVGEITQKYGTDVIAPTNPTKPGYIFGIWCTNEGPYEFTTMPAENITLYAEWIMVSWMILYDLDGGNWGDNFIINDGFTVETETFELEKPIKEGYTFIGWTGSNGEVPQTEVIIEKGNTEDLHFKANWEANEDTAYKVEHYKEKLEEDTYELAEEETLYGTTGKETEAVAKEYEGFKAEEVIKEEIAGEGNTVVKIYYKRESYEIVYKVDGEQYGEPETYKFEEEITIRENPHKEGHMFTGWTGTVATMPARDIEITGNFMINMYTLKIEYVYEDGSKARGTCELELEYGSAYSVETEEIAGYTADKGKVEGVIGASDVEVKVTYLADTDTAYKVEHYKEKLEEDTYELVEEETLYGTTREETEAVAKEYEGFKAEEVIQEEIAGEGTTTVKIYYKRESYEIVYKVDGEQYGEKETYKFEEEVTIKEEASKEGYTFSGWTGAVETMPANNVEITGRFEINSYTLKIEYVYADGSKAKETCELELEYGSAYSVETEEIAGYTADKEKVEGVIGASDVEVKVTYLADTDTAYKVEHYKENLDGTYSEIADEIKTKYGTTGEFTEAETKEYEGFTAGTVVQETIVGDGSTVVKIYYMRNTYTIKYYVDNEQYGETENYKYGETVEIREIPSKEGYEFDGWYENSDLEGEIITEIEEGHIGNINLYCNRMIAMYFITYFPVGEGGVGEENPWSYTVETETFTLNNPTWEGYTFIGWTGTDIKEPQLEVTIEKGSTGDRTYMPNWQANTDTPYTVKHYKENLDGTYNEEADEIETKYGTTGTRIDVTEKIYKGFGREDGTIMAVNGEIKGNGSTVFEFYYPRKSYELVYKVDGEQYGETESYKYEEPVTIKEEPSKEGHTFSGWTGVVEEMPASNVEVTGTFAINTYTLTINYVYIDGSEAQETHEEVLEYNSSYSIESPEIAGYTADVEVVEGTVGTENIEITVTYSADTDTAYKVEHYKENLDGTYNEEADDVETLYGTTGEFTEAEAKEYEGFTSQEVEERGIAGDGSTVIKIYYTRNSYDVVYKVDGQQYEEVKTYKYGEEVIIKEEPSKEGYTFSGWTGIVETMPARDVEITGTFTRNSYTLTIKYVYEDGSEAQETYTEIIDYNNPYSIESPEIAGYTTDKAEVSGIMEAENVEETVIYKANTDTAYKVEHYKEKLEEDTYEKVEEETLYGTTGKETESIAKEYEGFTAKAIEQETILGDGSTIVKVYYIRNSYELVYKVDEEQYGEPETYKFEEEITIKEEPSKEGHTFSGWTGTVETMPANNVEVTGTFEINSYMYKVEYYYNNIVDNTKTEEKQAEYQSVISSYEDKIEEGYKLGEVLNLPLTISAKEENNIIKVYYVIDERQTKELTYTVEYYKNGEKIENDTQTVNEVVQVLKPSALIVDRNLINETKYIGYKIEKTEPEQIAETIQSGSIIKIYYVERELASIEVVAKPSKTEYTAFENFDETGMKVAIIYDNGDKIEIDSDKYIIEPDRPLEVTDKNIVIKYKGNENITVEQEIIVNKAEGRRNPEYIESLEELQKEGTKEVVYYEGLKLGDIELLEGWEWKNPETKLYVNGEGETYKTIYRSQNMNYSDVENIVSILVKVTKAEPKYEKLQEIQAIKGESLEELKAQLPERYEFMDSLDTVMEKTGYFEYKVRYVPEDTDNYNIVENIPVIIHVVETEVPITDITMISEFKIVKGGKAKLIANIVPEDATNKEVEWISNNENIVTVDRYGNIEAKEIGVAYIIVKAKESGKTASCRVEVVEMIYEVEETEEGVYITEINPETKVEEFKEKFVTTYDIEIYNLEGRKIEDEEIIGTGYKMKLYNGEEQKEEITLMVKGDVTGEGHADYIDSAKIIYHRIGKEMLEGVYKKAADINKDGEINGIDSTILIYHRLKMDGYKWEN